ncbi:MAG: methyltransferase domain-containing protein [Luteitalea sp.]|nr:methyltransferase domain-containing protein [Luteitalea sp.]
MAGRGSGFTAFATRLFGWMLNGAAAARNGSDPWGPNATAWVQTRALKRFLACLSDREAPVLLDLGPVVGPNVAFFGEQLGCKIFVEDIHEDIERFARNGTWDQLPSFLSTRFDRPTESIDGILCWDLFDHLDKAAADALADELSRLLKPGGALLAFFATTCEATTGYSRFVVVDDNTLHHKSAASTAGRVRQASDLRAVPRGRHVLPSREIDRLFEGLRISQSFLLRARMRETLFRKPSPDEELAKAPVPVRRRKRLAAGRPKPAAASLNLAVGRASAGVRRTAPNQSHGVNGVSRQAHATEGLPLKARSKKVRVTRSEADSKVRATRFKLRRGQ